MMAFNPAFNPAQLLGTQQATTPMKSEGDNAAEALRYLVAAGGLFPGGPMPMLAGLPESLRQMIPQGLPLIYPGAMHPEIRPDMLQGAGGPMQQMFFDSQMGYHPYGLDGSRRKNATRETTAPLKQWLTDHRKNPYPTKAEKVLLACVTKMSLTQVSTWFANARRRLKKENKWSPQARGGEGDADDCDDLGDIGDDRPSSSASNRSEAKDSESALLTSVLNDIKDETPKKSKIWSIEETLQKTSEVKPEDGQGSSMQDSPTSDQQAAAFSLQQQMIAAAMCRFNPAFNPAMLGLQSRQGGSGSVPFYQLNPLLLGFAAQQNGQTNTNGSLSSEAASASPSSSHSPVVAGGSTEASPTTSRNSPRLPVKMDNCHD